MYVFHSKVHYDNWTLFTVNYKRFSIIISSDYYIGKFLEKCLIACFAVFLSFEHRISSVAAFHNMVEFRTNFPAADPPGGGIDKRFFPVFRVVRVEYSSSRTNDADVGRSMLIIFHVSKRVTSAANWFTDGTLTFDNSSLIDTRSEILTPMTMRRPLFISTCKSFIIPLTASVAFARISAKRGKAYRTFERSSPWINGVRHRFGM